MKIAACSSITFARFARLTSAAISSRSTAAVDSRSSQSAIGKSVSLGKIARERAGRLGARAFAAVHVDGQAQHDAGGLPLGGKREHARGVRREGLAGNGFDAGGDAAIRIRHGDADGFRAEVETDQRACRGQVGGGFDQRQDGGGHGPWVTPACEKGQKL